MNAWRIPSGKSLDKRFTPSPFPWEGWGFMRLANDRIPSKKNKHLNCEDKANLKIQEKQDNLKQTERVIVKISNIRRIASEKSCKTEK